MPYAYDADLGLWVVFLDDIVIDTADTEEEAKAKDFGEYLDEMYNDDYDHTGGKK